MASPTELLRERLASIEAGLYTRHTPIVITAWDPPHLKDSFIVTYVYQKKSMQGIPADEPSLRHVAEESDFFFIRRPRADAFLPKRAEELGATLSLAAWESAIHCSWEKIEWNQEYQMPPHIDPSVLLFSSTDIASCARGLSHFSQEQIQQYQTYGEYHFWNAQRHIYLARWGQVQLARWRCARNVEALTVAAVALGCPTEQERLAFLRRLKHLADSKIGR